MEHPFEIGQVYTNRQGDFKVVSIDEERQTMVLRYLDSGKEVVSPIATQMTIRENMQWENEGDVQPAVGARRPATRSGKDNVAFTADDFSTSLTGTSWRRREGVGGKVARLLAARTGLPFESFPRPRWPVVFFSHREYPGGMDFEQAKRDAKFTLSLDDRRAVFGLYIERADAPLKGDWDWVRFIAAMQTEPALQDLVTQVEARRSAFFIGRKSTGSAHFHYLDAPDDVSWLWTEDDAKARPVAERVTQLAEVEPDSWAEAYILAELSKEEALSLNGLVVEPIVEVMVRLLPLYRAAVGR